MLMANLQDDISDVELKQRWRLYWITTIFEFSNLKLQEMAWVYPQTAKWPEDEVWSSSFDECISAYFEILALDDAYEKAVRHANVSKQEADHAKKFHQLAAFYMEPDANPQEILQDEEWLRVVSAAKEFWEYLKKNVTSQREKDLMNNLEKKFPFSCD
ncbi:hypothetical protein LCX93_06185 [Sulfurimonas sp. SWIR-19]|uniref:hypothetical protein n=1 Tax=Sulfurimonas sp. SWIR-19 TaxID=2878390 RepID=UPI001CF46434|nr:hypothetical protein [Sulfurimonas sp. SWIR-19]UCN01504.1 hypothetical protein LCX93_06185 [Sulfurimonas sp. SWIR-19]